MVLTLTLPKVNCVRKLCSASTGDFPKALVELVLEDVHAGPSSQYAPTVTPPDTTQIDPFAFGTVMLSYRTTCF